MLTNVFYLNIVFKKDKISLNIIFSSIYLKLLVLIACVIDIFIVIMIKYFFYIYQKNK